MNGGVWESGSTNYGGVFGRRRQEYVEMGRSLGVCLGMRHSKK